MEDDERLAMCEDYIDAMELEADELRAELTEMFDKLLDFVAGEPVSLNVPWVMDNDSWTGIDGSES